MDQQEYEYKQYGNDNGYQDDGDYTYEFCEEIYDEAAKCNFRLGENYYFNDRTCNIVESIQCGLINEHGFLQYYQGGILDANPIVWMFILTYCQLVLHWHRFICTTIIRVRLMVKILIHR